MKNGRLPNAWLIGLGLLTASGVISLSAPAQSHGAQINYHVAPSVEIQATFDNGDPMANAQVAIFTPSDPATPWQTGLTDGAGNFRFSPDPNQLGDWEVQVRQAGHGDIITIPLQAEPSSGVLINSAPASSPAQKLLMTGLGLWGLLGTGLYFSRRSRAQPQVSEAQSNPTRSKQLDAGTSVADPSFPT